MSDFPTRLSSLEYIVPLSSSAQDIMSTSVLRDAIRAAGDTDTYAAVVISPGTIVPDPRDEPVAAEYVTLFSQDFESLETKIHLVTGGDPYLGGLDTEIFRGKFSTDVMRFAGRYALLDEEDTTLAIEHTLPDGVLSANKPVLISALEHRRRWNPSGRKHQFYTALVVPRSFELSLGDLHEQVEHLVDYASEDVSHGIQELVHPGKRSEMATRLAFSISYMMHVNNQRATGYVPQIPINN